MLMCGLAHAAPQVPPFSSGMGVTRRSARRMTSGLASSGWEAEWHSVARTPIVAAREADGQGETRSQLDAEIPGRHPVPGAWDLRTMPVINAGDYKPPVPSACAGCGGTITDRYYLLAVDRQWHVRCLMCCECKLPLDSELTCFARDGNIYCKEDYYRRFAVKRCARCQQGIFANELVMRAREHVFHLHCFTCAWCNATLTQGEYFGLRDNLAYCRTHYELLVHGNNFLSSEGAAHPTSGTGITGGGASVGSDRPSEGVLPPYPAYPSIGGGVRKGRPRKRKATEMGGENRITAAGNVGAVPVVDTSGCSLHLPPMEASPANPNPQGTLSGTGQTQRTKRMRTSFKHHQLRTMKSYFAINQNPDAKDLKQLAQKTGLSKRVLQVWFQNARAKWRRNNLKQHEQQQDPQQSSTQAANSQQPQQPSSNSRPPMSVGSPGSSRAYSTPSPSTSCAMTPETPTGAGSLSHVLPTSNLEFSPPRRGPMTPLVSHHSLHSGLHDPLTLNPYQEIF